MKKYVSPTVSVYGNLKDVTKVQVPSPSQIVDV